MDRYYLKSLRSNFPDTEYIILKKEIIDTCGISNYVWKNWMNGRTKIPNLAQPVIRGIVNRRYNKTHNFQLILDL